MDMDYDVKRKKLKGYIEGYWEQGWEGRIEYAFNVRGDDERKEEIIFLSKGQKLTIYNKEGKVLWRGQIELVRRSWWESILEKKLSVWSESKQKGVSYREWINWFWQEAPLKAELIMENNEEV